MVALVPIVSVPASPWDPPHHPGWRSAHRRGAREVVVLYSDRVHRGRRRPSATGSRRPRRRAHRDGEPRPRAPRRPGLRASVSSASCGGNTATAQVDVVIPVNAPAIRFMAETRARRLPRRARRRVRYADAERLAGFPPAPVHGGDLRPPHRLADRPGRGRAQASAQGRRVVLVAGEPAARSVLARAVRSGARAPSRARSRSTPPEGLSMPEMLDRLRNGTGWDGRPLRQRTRKTAPEASTRSTRIRLVADASRVPDLWVTRPGRGRGCAIGGYVFDYEREAEKAAGVALRILRGERPEAYRRPSRPRPPTPSSSTGGSCDAGTFRRAAFPRAAKSDSGPRRPGTSIGARSWPASPSWPCRPCWWWACSSRRAGGAGRRRARRASPLRDAPVRRDAQPRPFGHRDARCRDRQGRWRRLAECARRRPRRPGGARGRQRRLQADVRIREEPGGRTAAPMLEAARFPGSPGGCATGTSSGCRVSPSCPRKRRSTGKALEGLGTQAALIIPLTVGGAPLGVFARPCCASTSGRASW